MKNGAQLSACGTYRYMLWRQWRPSPATPIAVFIMLNPSTADAEKDDATIRRLTAFCKSWDMGGFIVVNAYAFRATKPADLYANDDHDAIGSQNPYWLRRAMTCAPSIIVCAWGANKVSPVALGNIKQALRAQSLVPKCFGITKDGHPRHPLYVPGNKQLEDFNILEREDHGNTRF